MQTLLPSTEQLTSQSLKTMDIIGRINPHAYSIINVQRQTLYIEAVVSKTGKSDKKYFGIT